jgi:uncharacterized protein (DUF952 family)
MLRIIYRYRQQPSQIKTLVRDEVVIGRAGSLPVDLDLGDDNAASRQHARLEKRDDAWWITDLGSRHGTFVNGVKITAPTLAQPEVEILIGQTMIYLEYGAAITSGVPTTRDLLTSRRVQEHLPDVSEQERIDLRVRAIRVIEQHSGTAMLEGLLRTFLEYFAKAERGSILLLDNEGKPVVAATQPAGASSVSFTLVNEVLKTRDATLWHLQSGHSVSMERSAARSAVYAPLLHRGQLIGVVHFDSTRLDWAFGERDLKLLAETAKIIAPFIAVESDGHPPRLPSIFISYSHRDQDFIRAQLVPDLRRRQIDVYFDEHLRAGEDWREQLAHAIRNTDALVLVMSPPAVISPEVAWEVEQARAAGKPVLPVMYAACEVPEALKAVQYVDIQGDYADGVFRLARDLELLGRG